MFCGKCGVENSDGAKFCRGCGADLGTFGGAKKVSAAKNIEGGLGVQSNSSATNLDVKKFADTIKSIPPKIFIFGGGIILALIIVVCIIANGGKTINLNEYLEIETTGYDGYGNVRANINWDAIEEKYATKISYGSEAKNEYGGFLEIMTPIDALKDHVSVNVDKSSAVSNGEEVAYNWDIDENLSNIVKCKIKAKNGTYKVEGLTEVGKFDAFDLLEVSFSGIAPNGSVNYNYKGSELSTYNFDFDKTSGLSVGETITATINIDNMEYFAENYGKIPEYLEKEYTVEGLDSYVTKVADISDSSLSDMQKQAEDIYSAYVAQRWGDGEELVKLEYIGNYLLTAKNPESMWGEINQLYLVYKAHIKNEYSNDEDSYKKTNYAYWYVEYTDLINTASGETKVDISQYNTPYESFRVDSGVDSGWWSTKAWDYNGFEYLDNLYKTVVTANLESYNHEDNVTDSKNTVEENTEEIKEIKDTENEEGFILPNSDKELLSKKDLKGLSKDDCKIARNEIYARHGRRFKDEDLQSYFDSCDWYEGVIDPDDFEENQLSDIEIENKNLIVEFEEEKGYR